jgi:outer membrane lipoprotein SlyB
VSAASVRDTSATTIQTKAFDAIGQIVGQAVGQAVGQVVGRGREMSVNVVSVDR